MISCLANGSPLNAAAMRCGYDGFHRLQFNQPYSDQAQVGAAIDSALTGLPRLSHMLEEAIKEAITPLPTDLDNIPVLLCLPEKALPNFFNNDSTIQELVNEVCSKLNLDALHPRLLAFWRHRCGFISALMQAQDLIHRQRLEFVLVVGLDSLLYQTLLAYYGGDLDGDGCRLLCDSNTNGFIPGEAATAVLLCNPGKKESEVLILGVGEGEEIAVINDEDHVLKGDGLAHAINNASEDSGIAIHKTAFRVASVSGEDYFFNEATLAQKKTLKQKVSEHRLWHPADSIGEVGAAVGGAMVVMVYYAFVNGYAPGNTALCHISNDNQQRGAFIMQYREKGD